MSYTPRTFEGWASLKQHRDALRSTLERRATIVALITAAIGFVMVQYSITGFAYSEFGRMFIAWSVLMSALVVLFLAPLTFMLLVFGWVDRRVHQFVTTSRIEVPRWPTL